MGSFVVALLSFSLVLELDAAMTKGHLFQALYPVQALNLDF